MMDILPPAPVQMAAMVSSPLVVGKLQAVDFLTGSDEFEHELPELFGKSDDSQYSCFFMVSPA